MQNCGAGLTGRVRDFSFIKKRLPLAITSVAGFIQTPLLVLYNTRDETGRREEKGETIYRSCDSQPNAKYMNIYHKSQYQYLEKSPSQDGEGRDSFFLWNVRQPSENPDGWIGCCFGWLGHSHLWHIDPFRRKGRREIFPALARFVRHCDWRDTVFWLFVAKAGRKCF